MKTRRTTFIGITLPLVVLLFSAVSIAGPVSDPPDQREIKVTARRFEFSPKTITVRRGERVKLVVTSEDVDYEFAINDFDIDQAIKARQTRVIELTPNEEGRFQLSCSVLGGDGHPEMVGELVVTGPPAGASAMKVTFDPIFSLTFSNTQTTTTARYNSSNQALPPNKFSIGFNLFRRLL